MTGVSQAGMRGLSSPREFCSRPSTLCRPTSAPGGTPAAGRGRGRGQRIAAQLQELQKRGQCQCFATVLRYVSHACKNHCVLLAAAPRGSPVRAAPPPRNVRPHLVPKHRGYAVLAHSRLKCCACHGRRGKRPQRGRHSRALQHRSSSSSSSGGSPCASVRGRSAVMGPLAWRRAGLPGSEDPKMAAAEVDLGTPAGALGRWAALPMRGRRTLRMSCWEGPGCVAGQTPPALRPGCLCKIH